MAAFDPSDDAPQLDFVLLSSGPASLFWDPSVLDSACATLTSLGYHLVQLDAGAWDDKVAMLDGVAEALSFPGYFGRNLDALNDCLFDVASGDNWVPEEAAGLVLVLTGFDSFATKDADAAHALVDIYAAQSRYAMLFGRRMLCLLQSDDPRLELPLVGSTGVSWNPSEWLSSKRGPRP
ncbi:barstar family protein [Xylanimonas protaetiae]|uniref:Barnase inhibitor n=1 Tax=Xylanimonas protaetiae TaxID=2509457 RepID=A0A4P6F893_9MICO|nr:barstar family protein [Xylanimonas protaetiae]QAY69487.1 barnase inhibitor [Xylanimonas protaetiae]